MQPPIESRSVPTNNVLLKVTVPKRRKKIRRTGDEGETTSKEEAKAAWARKSLPEKLKASKGKYKVEAVGMIDKTVRFRGLFLTFCPYEQRNDLM
jgi:general transcription factor 3C polypeptide 5 (transcription factor C subunit 1)